VLHDTSVGQKSPTRNVEYWIALDSVTFAQGTSCAQGTAQLSLVNRLHVGSLSTLTQASIAVTAFLALATKPNHYLRQAQAIAALPLLVAENQIRCRQQCFQLCPHCLQKQGHRRVFSWCLHWRMDPLQGLQEQGLELHWMMCMCLLLVAYAL